MFSRLKVLDWLVDQQKPLVAGSASWSQCKLHSWSAVHCSIYSSPVHISSTGWCKEKLATKGGSACSSAHLKHKDVQWSCLDDMDSASSSLLPWSAVVSNELATAGGFSLTFQSVHQSRRNAKWHRNGLQLGEGPHATSPGVAGKR